MAIDGGVQHLAGRGDENGASPGRRSMAAACGACFVAVALALLIGFELSGLKNVQAVCSPAATAARARACARGGVRPARRRPPREAASAPRGGVRPAGHASAPPGGLALTPMTPARERAGVERAGRSHRGDVCARRKGQREAGLCHVRALQRQPLLGLCGAAPRVPRPAHGRPPQAARAGGRPFIDMRDGVLRGTRPARGARRVAHGARRTASACLRADADSSDTAGVGRGSVHAFMHA